MNLWCHSCVASTPTRPISTEARFAVLARTHPERAEQLLRLAQADVNERWRYYSQLGAIERTVAHDTAEEA